MLPLPPGDMDPKALQSTCEAAVSMMQLLCDCYIVITEDGLIVAADEHAAISFGMRSPDEAGGKVHRLSDLCSDMSFQHPVKMPRRSLVWLRSLGGDSFDTEIYTSALPVPPQGVSLLLQGGWHVESQQASLTLVGIRINRRFQDVETSDGDCSTFNATSVTDVSQWQTSTLNSLPSIDEADESSGGEVKAPSVDGLSLATTASPPPSLPTTPKASPADGLPLAAMASPSPSLPQVLVAARVPLLPAQTQTPVTLTASISTQTEPSIREFRAVRSHSFQGKATRNLNETPPTAEKYVDLGINLFNAYKQWQNNKSVETRSKGASFSKMKAMPAVRWSMAKFSETPQTTAVTQIISILKSLNIRNQGCCFYHTGLAFLRQCIRQMAAKPCLPHFLPHQEWQCCGCCAMHAGRPGVAFSECLFCGHAQRADLAGGCDEQASNCSADDELDEDDEEDWPL